MKAWPSLAHPFNLVYILKNVTVTACLSIFFRFLAIFLHALHLLIVLVIFAAAVLFPLVLRKNHCASCTDSLRLPLQLQRLPALPRQLATCQRIVASFLHRLMRAGDGCFRASDGFLRALKIASAVEYQFFVHCDPNVACGHDERY